MIKIIKENNEKIVTKGAYEDFYKPLGYIIVNDKQPSKKEVEIKKSEELDKDKETQKKTKEFKEYSRK
ncbi:MAG: hypothetical protein IIW92_01405 [Lachnospiraceae bacterium]|nr:hypothetical protein [Lachnospiraceae bacterium]